LDNGWITMHVFLSDPLFDFFPLTLSHEEYNELWNNNC